MRKMEEVRRTEVKQPDGTWVTATWEQLDQGDTIRMFDPDGSPVVSLEDKTTEWTVHEQPCLKAG